MTHKRGRSFTVDDYILEALDKYVLKMSEQMAVDGGEGARISTSSCTNIALKEFLQKRGMLPYEKKKKAPEWQELGTHMGKPVVRIDRGQYHPSGKPKGTVTAKPAPKPQPVPIIIEDEPDIGSPLDQIITKV